jgi:transcriptional regulator with XRE-family HTH domain
MKDTTSRYTGTKIREVLRQQGRRQDWLAEQLGVTPATVNRWIHGSRSVDPASARRVSEILDVPFYLLFDVPTGTIIGHIGSETAA